MDPVAHRSNENGESRARGGEMIFPPRHGRVDYGPVSGKPVPGGVVHKLPADLRTALAAWKDITPLARNEFICAIMASSF